MINANGKKNGTATIQVRVTGKATIEIPLVSFVGYAAKGNETNARILQIKKEANKYDESNKLVIVVV